VHCQSSQGKLLKSTSRKPAAGKPSDSWSKKSMLGFTALVPPYCEQDATSLPHPSCRKLEVEGAIQEPSASAAMAGVVRIALRGRDDSVE
jgi:hypothetical protein